MFRFLIAFALLAFPLSACNTLPANLATQSPAPLAATQIDETALDTAWRSYDAALDAINLLIDAKVIIPGSAKAKVIADANDRVLAALTAAEHARAALSTTDYLAALSQARIAIADVRAALGSK